MSLIANREAKVIVFIRKFELIRAKQQVNKVAKDIKHYAL